MTDADEPLKDEAAKRDEWRDDERARPSGEGSRPASEDEDARAEQGEDRVGPPGVTPPPD